MAPYYSWNKIQISPCVQKGPVSLLILQHCLPTLSRAYYDGDLATLVTLPSSFLPGDLAQLYSPVNSYSLSGVVLNITSSQRHSLVPQF